MEYVPLGKTGIKVSKLCFGTMSFGGIADEKTSVGIFHRCREVGINFFDTANSYSQGKSEKILGKLIADCRDEVIINSKAFDQMGKGINARGSSRRNISLSIEASLKRLKTDYIDVYFLHHFDYETPIEQTLRALDDLVKSGKIHYIGVSNFAAWQTVQAIGVSIHQGLAKIEVVQPMYNLVKRQAEVEILPMAEANNIGVIPYNPLGAGLLTGKYGTNFRPESGRLLDSQMYKKRYSEKIYFEVAEQFSSLAKKYGVDPVSLSLAWVSSHPAVTAPIVGARNLEQLEGSIKSLDIEMTCELRDEISAISPSPPVATDRSEEKM